MEGILVFGAILVVVAVGLVPLLLGRSGAARVVDLEARDRYFEQLAARLEAPVAAVESVRQPDGGFVTVRSVSGLLDGDAIVVHAFVGRTRPRTQVHAPAHLGEVTLRLRPTRFGDAAAISRGEAIDVQVGDAAFDAAHLIEGAPAEVIRAVFDV